MDYHGDRIRSGGATGRPWRGGGVAAGNGGGPPPPKVYRVEPRDFRELVQRLTGAGTPAAAAPGPPPAHQRAGTLTPAMVTADTRRAAQTVPAPVPTEQQFDYASWFSAPLLSPATYGGAPGFGGGHHQIQQHHQGSSGALL